MRLQLLLAAASPGEANYWERFSANPNTALTVEEMSVVAGIAAAAALVWWVWIMWQRSRERRRYHSQQGLFDELCQAHQLSRRDCATLAALAKAQRLAQPAFVFLRPEIYWPPHLPPDWASRQKSLVPLHARLFGHLEEPSIGDSASR